jgi:hypothetical protein
MNSRRNHSHCVLIKLSPALSRPAALYSVMRGNLTLRPTSSVGRSHAAATETLIKTTSASLREIS